MRVSIFVLVAICVSGCASPVYYGGSSQQQTNADLYQCQKANPDEGITGSMISQCMRAKGYAVEKQLVEPLSGTPLSQ